MSSGPIQSTQTNGDGKLSPFLSSPRQIDEQQLLPRLKQRSDPMPTRRSGSAIPTPDAPISPETHLVHLLPSTATAIAAPARRPRSPSSIIDDHELPIVRPRAASITDSSSITYLQWQQFAAPSNPSNARPGNPSRPNPMPDPTPTQIDPAVPPTFSTHHAVLSAIEGITAPSVGRTTHLHPANDHLLRSILTAIMDHTTGHSLGIPKSINTSSPESMIQPFTSITARISRKNPDDGQPATAHRPTASNARTHYHASNSSPMLAARSTSSVRNRPCQRAATTHLGQMPSSNDAHQSRQHLNTGQAPCDPTTRPCQRHTQHASSSPCAIIKIINSMETCQPNLGRDG
ncbi:hypothetical protein ACLOJK_036847 [Asimina triloba]